MNTNKHYKETFIRLTESATGQAEVTNAIRKIGSDLQTMANKLANYKTDEVAKIINKTKIEFGMDFASAFQSKAISKLDELIELLTTGANEFFDSSYMLDKGELKQDEITSAIEEIEDSEEESEESEESEEAEEAEVEDIDLDDLLSDSHKRK